VVNLEECSHHIFLLERAVSTDEDQGSDPGPGVPNVGEPVDPNVRPRKTYQKKPRKGKKIGRMGEGGGVGSHRSKTKRERDLLAVARMSRRGFTLHEMAQELGVSPSTITLDLRRLRARYQKEAGEEHQVLVAEKRAQYREVRKEAWEQWERSKQNARRKVVEASVNADGTPGRQRTTLTTEGRLADTAYLRTIIETLRDESALDGLNAPRKVDANVNVMNWDALFVQVEDGQVDDVEKQLASLEESLEALTAPGGPGGDTTSGEEGAAGA
jgi:AcrR family transcriptional regulator